MQQAQVECRIGCVLANPEYETWFIAAYSSLNDFIAVADGEAVPGDPELNRLGKGWIKRHFRGASYSETIEQPRMTAAMDLRECRRNSCSFDKLCRELEKWTGISSGELTKE